jgi:hypothetical protein
VKFDIDTRDRRFEAVARNGGGRWKESFAAVIILGTRRCNTSLGTLRRQKISTELTNIWS